MDDGWKIGVDLNSRKANVDAYNDTLHGDAGRPLGRGEKAWAAVGIVAVAIFLGSILWRTLARGRTATNQGRQVPLLTFATRKANDGPVWTFLQDESPLFLRPSENLPPLPGGPFCGEMDARHAPGSLQHSYFFEFAARGYILVNSDGRSSESDVVAGSCSAETD